MEYTAAALRRYRTANDLTLKELGAQLSVNKTTLLRWETGEASPDADMIERIVIVTGGAVTATDMHETRLAWLKAQGRFSMPTNPAPTDAATEKDTAS